MNTSPSTSSGVRASAAGGRSADAGEGGRRPRPLGESQRKELRKAVRAAERAWSKAENEVAALQGKLADPDVYGDPDRVAELAKLHDEAKDRASELGAAWEQEAARLEAASG